MKPFIRLSITLMTVIALHHAEDLVAQVEPFAYRATLDPFKIQQLPELQMHSRQRSDFMVQRSVVSPGIGGWHIHPGPGFSYVLQGHVQIQKYSEKDGCYQTSVFGPGDVYIKPANEVHRAVVVGDEALVELIVRFNLPEGGPAAIPVPNPGCPDPLGFVVSQAVPLSHAPEVDTLENFIAQQVSPFTVRASLDEFQLHELPDFLMHSGTPLDIVFQRGVFAPGAGIWHIHPGPSFVYVIDGEIKLEKFTKKTGIFETPVHGPGAAYFEEGNQVHRAVVMSEQSAVLMVVRFIPRGAPITIPVPAPGN